jgi:hypothetical protein
MTGMNEIIPYIFLIFFIGMWIFVSKVLSFMGGWKDLSEYYRTEEQFRGKGLGKF